MDEGFTVSEATPGQQESRAARPHFEVWLATDEDAERREKFGSVYRSLLAERVTREDGRLAPRWDWRKAVFITWSLLPPALRRPRFQQDLAELLGLTSADAFRKWRQHDPEIDERIRTLPVSLMSEYVPAVLDALVTVASERVAAGHQDRELFLEMVGLYKKRSSHEMTGKDGETLPVTIYIPSNGRD